MISQGIKRQRKFNSTRAHLKIAQGFTSLRGKAKPQYQNYL
ncbi:hypothetical protein FHT86_002432 [Rhizobium sp. BK313]|nr:hypothetical protein [Rhizobium sp. BK313]